MKLAEVEPRPSHVPNLAAIGCIDDHTLFRALGFDKVESLDFSSWEGADYIADLNRPLPAELHGRFDAVFEAGTIQHVFHLPQVLANIHALLKEGGRAIHGMATSSNHVDHGFYMYSPTLFHDFYSENGWRIDAAFFYEFFPYWHRHRFDSAPWKIYRYEPGCLDDLAYGGMGAAQLALFFAVTRSPGATARRGPPAELLPPLLARRRGGAEKDRRAPARGAARAHGRPGLAADRPSAQAGEAPPPMATAPSPRKLPPIHARY